MAKSAVIRGRTEASLKEQVDIIFEKIGLNTSQALNLFYKQVLLHKGLPFDIKIPNHLTRQAIDDARKGKTEKFSSVDDLFNDLES
ncbi:MAG: type II toxin-antitoxin system RelB/DinJ family antitoxin [Candidatus Marinimicrobia bacterium]|nr:type II toxin-antitoxin system RelB/DinJ family antitoxin [Candidatus Neomarinimicrobiota bacterium]